MPMMSMLVPYLPPVTPQPQARGPSDRTTERQNQRLRNVIHASFNRPSNHRSMFLKHEELNLMWPLPPPPSTKKNFCLSTPPPKNGAKNGFLHLMSPAAQFRYQTPLIWGC